MTKTNTYDKIKNFLNQNNLSYSEKYLTYNKVLIIDGSVSNQYYYVSLDYAVNSKTTVRDITYDIENLVGEVETIDYRISYNQLINQLSDLING